MIPYFAQHYKDATDWPWMHFTPREVACRHCGELLIQRQAMDKLERLRTALGKPVTLNCGYRCPKHNAEVGGSPHSQHKLGEAFDVSLHGLDRYTLTALAEAVGFTAIGQYDTFIHLDDRAPKADGKLYTWDYRHGA